MTLEESTAYFALLTRSLGLRTSWISSADCSDSTAPEVLIAWHSINFICQAAQQAVATLTARCYLSWTCASHRNVTTTPKRRELATLYLLQVGGGRRLRCQLRNGGVAGHLERQTTHQ